MTKPPLVSVLIPSYNHEAYIEETIHSVQSQTIKDIEILILDDGSTDDSPAIIERISQQDSRVRCWRRPNSGLIPTLNELAQQAKAPFVAQIDSDDIWAPERLAWGLEDMSADAALSVSFCSFVRICAAGKPIDRADQLKVGLQKHAALIKRITVKNAVCACTAFMRSSALRKIGPFAREYTLVHDWDRWLRLSLVGNLHLDGRVGACYREHDRNQSLDIKTTRQQELDIIDDLAASLISHHRLDLANQAEMHSRAAALAYDTDQLERMVHHLLRKSNIFPLFEHEQVWLLYTMLQERQNSSVFLGSMMPQTSRNLFTPENQARYDQIMAYKCQAPANL